MLWRKTLNLWKLALTANADLAVKTFLAFLLLNLLFFTPLQPLAAFAQNLLTFALIIFFGKLYLSNPEEKTFLARLMAASFGGAVKPNLLPALALVLAQYVMTFLLLVFLVAGLMLVAALFGVTLFVFGTALPLWAVGLLVVALVFLYFSMATSYPLFFARALIEAKDAKDYFIKFLTAPFSPLLLKMGFSIPLLTSSLIVSAVALLLFVVQFLLYHLLPFTTVFSFYFTYANLLLIYLFGVISLKAFLEGEL
ncbi:MAG: DUF4175 domain-containing protein [Aquificae bacterium]|nr:DUF4175 domain-containing protein [Aquificota bacterium]